MAKRQYERLEKAEISASKREENLKSFKIKEKKAKCSK